MVMPLPRLGFPPLGKRKSHLPPREILRIPPQPISHTLMPAEPKQLRTPTNPWRWNTSGLNVNPGAMSRACRHGQLQPNVSGRAPTRRRRLLPCRVFEEEGRCWPINVSHLRVRLPVGRGARKVRWMPAPGPPSPWPKAGSPQARHRSPQCLTYQRLWPLIFVCVRP